MCLCLGTVSVLASPREKAKVSSNVAKEQRFGALDVCECSVLFVTYALNSRAAYISFFCSTLNSAAFSLSMMRMLVRADFPPLALPGGRRPPGMMSALPAR